MPGNLMHSGVRSVCFLVLFSCSLIDNLLTLVECFVIHGQTAFDLPSGELCFSNSLLSNDDSLREESSCSNVRTMVCSSLRLFSSRSGRLVRI